MVQNFFRSIAICCVNRKNRYKKTCYLTFFFITIDFFNINSNNMSGEQSRENKEQRQEQSRVQESGEQYPPVQINPYNYYSPYYPPSSMYNIPPLQYNLPWQAPWQSTPISS